MNDTSPDIAEWFRKLMMQKTGEERLLMGCSMYDAAKQIVKDSVCNAHPGITNSEIRREIFVRFYGQDFRPADRKKILLYLAGS
jgi:dihydrofolate reductase